NTASQRLEEARRLLDQEKSAGAQRGMADAQRTARALQEQEQQVAAQVAKLGEQQEGQQGGQQASGQQSNAQRQGGQPQSGRPHAQQALAAEKAAMADTLRDLTRRIEQLAGEQAQSKPGASRALGEAADTLRGRRIEDRIRASQQQLGTASQD